MILALGGVSQQLVNRLRRNMAEGVRRRHLAMGRVSIWAQWLIIVSAVFLSPLFVLVMAGQAATVSSQVRKPTHRWSKADSNHRSPSRGFAVITVNPRYNNPRRPPWPVDPTKRVTIDFGPRSKGGGSFSMMIN